MLILITLLKKCDFKLGVCNLFLMADRTQILQSVAAHAKFTNAAIGDRSYLRSAAKKTPPGLNKLTKLFRSKAKIGIKSTEKTKHCHLLMVLNFHDR